jgi:hypothetical protein
MYKLKLTENWQLISESANLVQIRSNSNLPVAVFIGAVPNDDIYFLFNNTELIELSKPEQVWAKAFNTFSCITALQDVNRASCFNEDGSFDCGGFVVLTAPVYC